MKWWCWLILFYAASFSVMAMIYLIEDEKKKKKVHRKCEKIRQAHRKDKIEKGYITKPLAYLDLLEIQIHVKRFKP